MGPSCFEQVSKICVLLWNWYQIKKMTLPRTMKGVLLCILQALSLCFFVLNLIWTLVMAYRKSVVGSDGDIFVFMLFQVQMSLTFCVVVVEFIKCNTKLARCAFKDMYCLAFSVLATVKLCTHVECVAHSVMF
jgi:hypothetical protein